MKKNIVFFILGLIVSGFSVYALNIDARNTAYDNTNSGSSATNMQDAIDDLYERSGKGTIIDCGTYSHGIATSHTVDIKSYYDKYANLTAENIYIIPITVLGSVTNASSNQSKSTSITPSFTYSSSTGIITVSGLYASTGGNATITACYVTSFKVLIIV